MKKYYQEDSHIIINGLEIMACHGVNPEEKVNPQKWVVDVDLVVDISKAAKEDLLDLTINYAKVSKFIVAFFKDNCFDLIETLVSRLAKEILVNYKIAKKITLEVKKPNAPMNQVFNYVSVKTTKEWTTCYIALGSNLGDKNKYLDNAIQKLKDTKEIEFVKESRRIETKPYGDAATEDFVNSCAEIRTVLTPQELLEKLNEIEASENRTREVHWGNRTLDLDIIYYGDYIVDEPNLKIPHVDMTNRVFVLDPLCQLCPKKPHPVLGLTTEQLLNKLLKF